VVLVIAGCSTVVDGRALVGVPRPGTPIQWGPCDPTWAPDVDIPPEAECGMLSVPVDYAKPGGNVARLAMIRIKATGDKIGSMLVNPGGPGESGIVYAAGSSASLPDSVRQRFDYVGFDPRGVGSSTPAVHCNTDEENDQDRADPPVEFTPEGIAHVDARNKTFAQRCFDRTGKEFLANVGTVDVARDLDAMRAALGDAKLTYLGYSYGTSIGAAYAEMFPDTVRALILDGAQDPNADPVELGVAQAAAFQKAFDDYAADCAKHPSCPLGTDPAKAVAVYRDLVLPLATTPAETHDPRGLSYGDAITGTIQAMYSPQFWKHLTVGLSELREGRGDTLLALADFYLVRDAHGHYGNLSDAFTGVSCVDRPPITDLRVLVEADRRGREVAPFSSYGEFTGNVPQDGCAFWTVPPTSTPHQLKVDGLPPTLVVSTTHDPATPYQAGVDLAKELGAALLTFEGTQHTVVFDGISCVDDIATKYLVDVVVPPADARC
jgi:pimeloyl-ACP methyl ester carboxylesterase